MVHMRLLLLLSSPSSLWRSPAGIMLLVTNAGAHTMLLGFEKRPSIVIGIIMQLNTDSRVFFFNFQTTTDNVGYVVFFFFFTEIFQLE